MKYFKQAMLWGLKYGIPIGLAINYTVILIFSGIYGTSYLSFGYMLKNYVIGVLVGFGFSALPVIYKIKSWSILRQTVVHFISMLCIYLPCSLIAGWIPMSAVSITIFIIIFTVAYLCYWFSFYFYWKAKIRKLNVAIKNKK